MNVSGQKRQLPLRLVVSSTTTGRMPKSFPDTARPQLVVDDQPRMQLLQTMTLIGNARRNAARRLAHKQALARRTLILLIATCIGIWSWLALNAAAIDPSTHRRLAFVAILSAVVALLLSCRRAEGRVAVSAHQLSVCASEIGELRAAVSSGRGEVNAASVHEIRELYRGIMRRCTADHIYADFLAARLSGEAKSAAGWLANLYYFIDVYPMSIAALALPACFAVLG